MANVRMTLNKNTEISLSTAAGTGTMECIYATCVGFSSSPSPETIAGIVESIHSKGMTPILYTDANQLYDLGTIEVSSISEIDNVASDIVRNKNTAVLIKCQNEFYIYGVTSAQKWQLTPLTDSCFNALSFSATPQQLKFPTITRQMYSAIRAVNGHAELHKWRMENSATVEKVRALGGKVEDLPEWEKKPEWQALYKHIEKSVNELSQFNKLKRTLEEDIATYLETRGKNRGLTREDVKTHILKEAAYFIAMAKPNDANSSLPPSLVLFVHLFQFTRDIVTKQLPHFKYKMQSVKLQPIFFDEPELAADVSSHSSASSTTSPKLSPHHSGVKNTSPKKHQAALSVERIRDGAIKQLIDADQVELAASLVKSESSAISLAVTLAQTGKADRFLEALRSSSSSSSSRSQSRRNSPASSSPPRAAAKADAPVVDLEPKEQQRGFAVAARTTAVNDDANNALNQATHVAVPQTTTTTTTTTSSASALQQSHQSDVGAVRAGTPSNTGLLAQRILTPRGDGKASVAGTGLPTTSPYTSLGRSSSAIHRAPSGGDFTVFSGGSSRSGRTTPTPAVKV